MEDLILDITPQIEDIMSKATDKFKNDPYVKDYYQVATENQARQNGLHEVEPQPTAPLTNAPLTNTPPSDEKTD